MDAKQDFADYRWLKEKSSGLRGRFWTCTFLNGIALFVLFSAVGVLLTQILALATGDNAFTGKAPLLYIVLVLILAALSGFAAVGFCSIEQRVQLEIRGEMLTAWIRGEETAASGFTGEEVLARCNVDLPQAVNLIGYYMSGWIWQPILSGVLSCLWLVWVDWRIALLCVACSGINMLLMRVGAQKLQGLNLRITEGKSSVLAFLQECINGAVEIRTFHLQDVFHARLEEKSKAPSSAIVKTDAFLGLRRGLMVFFADGFTVLSLLLLGAWLADKGSIAFSDVMLALPLADQIGQMMAAFPNRSVLIRQFAPNVRRVREITEIPQMPEADDTKAEPAMCGLPALQLTDIGFAYGDHPVLRHISLTIHPGEKVAVVGGSGSGKTTLLRLILGLYHPDEGAICAGGMTQQRTSSGKWLAMFAYMPQNSGLFHRSIAGNIAMDSAPDLKKVEKAAMSANVLSCIERAGGLSAIPPEGNKGFSGGEIQRINLARALYRDAPILLLDEPTSALDKESEAVIRQTLDQLAEEKTVLMVTHRLVLAEHFDRVIVLDNGRIAEEGTHTELLQKKGIYAAMWEKQKEK